MVKVFLLILISCFISSEMVLASDSLPVLNSSIYIQFPGNVRIDPVTGSQIEVPLPTNNEDAIIDSELITRVSHHHLYPGMIIIQTKHSMFEKIHIIFKKIDDALSFKNLLISNENIVLFMPINDLKAGAGPDNYSYIHSKKVGSWDFEKKVESKLLNFIKLQSGNDDPGLLGQIFNWSTELIPLKSFD